MNHQFVKERLALVPLVLGLGYAVSPWSNAGLALLAGVAVAVLFGNPWQAKTKVFSQKLLAYSIVGLGAGMNLVTVAKVGAAGVGYTMASICLSLAAGLLLGRWVRSDAETSLLISVGTAICGGSAIAAVAPVIRAKPHSISVALGTVFLLNALALFVFPQLGHALQLSQSQFGLWSALAIHDTSSVVGASMQYGSEALAVGTTVKLARALWIVPLTLLIGRFWKSPDDKEQAGQAKKPWFILGFLIMAAVVTWVPQLRPIGGVVELVAKKCLVVTLFLIGSNLTVATIKSVGFRPLVQGVVLWFLVLSVTLIAVKSGVISL